jgi:iron only hydrogenase large subunit-like protein
MSLSKVVDVIPEKCLNCHACIDCCPSKFCQNASGDYIEINHDLCIGCGQCIDACTWHARVRVDDIKDFFTDLSRHVKMVAVVAPAIAVAFPNKFLNFNGWLKSMGVDAIFDVSFGAELTVYTYVEHIKNDNPRTVIAQPCPVIVNYIELYRPELLKYLAPADSPMLHTMKMIREFYPQYSQHKIAVISPCIAKKREYEATGFGDYNVTMASLDDYFAENHINLSGYPATKYDDPPAERAVMFSTPGGLMETALRWNNDLRAKIRKIEGLYTVYHYLDHLESDIKAGRAPLIVDCLNCHSGCNGGTGTKCHHLSLDYLENIIEQRRQSMQRLYSQDLQDCSDTNESIQEKVLAILKRYWRPGLYHRTYKNRSHDNYSHTVPQADLEKVYASMHKDSVEDHVNCPACGYGNCKDMAIAIHYGLNKAENCHHYLSTFLNRSMEHRKVAIETFHEFISSQFDARNTESRFAPILKAIQEVALQTSILSINASIEATRAGNAGAGFGVVAKEIGELSKKARAETEKMHESLVELNNLTQKAIEDFESEIQSW